MHLHRGLSPLAPTLRGRFVRLEPSDPSHDAALVAAANEPEPAPDWSFRSRSAEEFAARRAQFATEGSVLYTVIRDDDDRVVGETAFYELEWLLGRDVPDVCEVGYTWYAPSVRRTAVNTETKRLLFAHAFETWGVQRVALRTDARNLASRKAMERLGLVFEGVRRGHKLGVLGDIRDSAFYSVVAEEWPAMRARLDAMLRR